MTQPKENVVASPRNERAVLIDELVAALESIAEYWNRDQNEQAMADACWHAINTAEAALSKARGEQP